MIYSIINLIIGKEDSIIQSERQFPSHRVKIFVLLNSENQKEDYKESLEKLTKFYDYWKIRPEIIYLQESNFMNLVTQIAVNLLEIPANDQIQILLPSEGSINVTLALISAGLQMRELFDRSINFISLLPNIKEKQRFEIGTAIDLLPSLKPSKLDREILLELETDQTLTQLAEKKDISVATVSQRIRTLQEFGYVTIQGRERYLTDLGLSIVEMHKAAIKSSKEAKMFDLNSIVRFLDSTWKVRGFSYSPEVLQVDPKNTYGGLATYWLLTGRFPEDYEKIKIKLYQIKDKLYINLGNRRLRADSTSLHRIIVLSYLLDRIDTLPIENISIFFESLFDNETKSYRIRPYYKETELVACWEILTACHLLNIEPPYKPLEFIQNCMIETGGFCRNPSLEKHAAPYISTTFNGLSLAHQLDIKLSEKFLKNTINYLKSFWMDEYFINPSLNQPTLFANHDIILSMKILNLNTNSYKNRLFNFLSKLQDPSGGFYTRFDGPHITPSNCYGAVSLISLLDNSLLNGREINYYLDLIKVRD
ncbi:MAG: prenyltransferase/squalene oxidase repeat-containing protein [Candidatus Helarchaeota archaeon]